LPNEGEDFSSSPNPLIIQRFTFDFSDMTDASPSTPRRSRRHKVLTSAAAGSSGPRPSRDVTTSPAAGPSRPRRYRDVTTAPAAGPSEPRRYRDVTPSPVAGPSEPRPSTDVAMSAAAGPSEPRPAKLPRYMSGHHDVAMSEVTRPRSHDRPHSTARPSPQYSLTNSAYPSAGQRQCTKYLQWQNPDQFQGVNRRRQTKTCLRCRQRGKVCISCP